MSHMYSQDRTDAAEQRPEMSHYVKSLHGWSILVGAVIGLIIGLVIGWVLWPVQWTNAWPADLSQEAKAQYLASVAQVYAYYPDDRAVETARMQLYDLDENLADEIAAAQAYFDENPQRDSRVHITMLGQLAEGLGVTSDDIVVGAGETEPAGAGEAESSAGGPSWIRWIFSLLLVVLLIGGGIYIISRLAQRRQGVLDGEDNDPNQPGGSYAETAPTAAAQSSASSKSVSQGARGGFDAPAADDYQFDQEDDAILYSGGAALVASEEYVDEAYFDEDSAAGLSRSGTVDTAETREPDAGLTAPVASAPPAPQAASKPVRAEVGRVLNTYLVHYQAGIVDFEQSHNIIDPATSRYIGECGMGVNVKNGILQDVPENVIALDVWLFDQKRDKSLGNQTRVLLSEYAIDHDLEQAFIREKPDGPQPVVAQPGVSFQLKGQNLILDCEVLDADYTKSSKDSGIFRSVKVEMTVRARD